MREFLRYIADCAIKEAPESATEQQIGVHVFHRPPGYNSSEDSIVRTHARLLRQKLAEYFSTEGAAEPTIIEVPKGHYLPIFRPAHLNHELRAPVRFSFQRKHDQFPPPRPRPLLLAAVGTIGNPYPWPLPWSFS